MSRGKDYKCIRHYKSGKVTRMLRDAAQALVLTGDFQFVPRSAWKEAGRPGVKIPVLSLRKLAQLENAIEGPVLAGRKETT